MLSPPFIPSPKPIIKNNKTLLYVWTWFGFLGLLLNILPRMKVMEVKHITPILHFDGIIYFATVNFCPNVDQYFFVFFQYFPEKMFWLDLPSLTPIILLRLFLQVNSQKTPNMDVVRLDTYLTIDHKIDDINTYHIHNQA